MSRALVLALLMGTLCSGCTTWQMLRAPRLAPCSGPLVSTELIPGDFTTRHSARIQGGAVDLALSLVLQKRGDRLLLVGFGVLGAKSFAVRQVGADVEVEHFGPRPAVPAENVLRDLHRVHFPEQLGLPGPDVPGVDVALDRSPEGQVVARIENRRCGYTATYVTLASDRLP